MIRVNNRKTINLVAVTSLKTNKVRNLFAVIAIILTTVLFTGMFTIASSLLASMEESTMRQVGGSAHGGFKYLTAEQYETIKKHPSIKEISYSVVLATAENEELAKRPTEIRYANDTLEAEMMFSMPTTGRLPKAADEIATDTLVLERMGIPAKLGESVTLTYSVRGKKYTDTFKLVGFWTGDIIMPASQVWLSKTYVDGILQDIVIDKEIDTIGLLNADVNFENSWNIESKLWKVILDSGYELDEINYGVNWAYTGGNSLDIETIVGVAMVLFMIIFCGYLMISNVFLISVTKDIHFYGLLKTIGTTGKQIKRIIRKQALMISLVGIPFGLLLGCVTGGILAPYVLDIMNTNIIKVSLKLWIFVFATIFVLITVFISVRKAAKIAAKVSPMEALHINEASIGGAKVEKHGETIRLWKMAAENVLRNRKKVVLVTTSISLSLIILNTAFTMANGFDLNKYVSKMISHDFVIGDVTWFNVYSFYADQNTLSDDLLEEICNQDGMKSLERVFFAEQNCKLDEYWDDMAIRAKETLEINKDWLSYMQEEIENGEAIYHIYGVDDAVWEDFTVWEGEIDLEKLHSGAYVVASPYDTEGKLSAYHVGDMVEVFGTDGKSRTCEVLAIASIPYNISIQHAHPVNINFYIPSDVFLSQVAQKCPMVVTIDVEDAQIENMEKFLSDYSETKDPNLQYASKSTYIEEYEATQRTYRIVGIVLSVLLALIGIANYANTSITSIMTRKRELAVLHSIGMTVKQQRTMLIWEGIDYMVLAAIITWTLGTLLGMCGLTLLTGGSDCFTIRYTILPSVYCMPVFLLLAIIIPSMCQKMVDKESIIDRLRHV